LAIKVYKTNMPSFSIPQILAAVLSIIAVVLAIRHRTSTHHRPFLLLTLAGAVQAVLVSLRWDYGVADFRLLQVALAGLLPGMAWISFRAFKTQERNHFWYTDLLHVLPAASVVLSFLFLPDLIDVIIIATNIGYGTAFLRLLRTGESVFDRAALDGLPNLRRALAFVTFSLLGSVVVDGLVLTDFIRTQGSNAALLVGIGNFILLAALVATVLSGSAAMSDAEEDEVEPVRNDAPTEDDKAIVSKVQSLLIDGGLAKHPDLTLKRIASRLVLPARAVSQAINRAEGCNVSQFVNTVRVNEACRLLAKTAQPVTAIMFDSGFQTKSNFNREFLRVTGKTPREWRQEHSLVKEGSH
jgi:AraC-like DNA-binding protein